MDSQIGGPTAKIVMKRVEIEGYRSGIVLAVLLNVQEILRPTVRSYG